MTLSWLYWFVHRSDRVCQGGGRRAVSRRVPPQVEQLEDRTLLATSVNEVAVALFYQNYLRRDVELAGLQAWAGKIDAGHDLSTVVRELQGSHEYKAVQVRDAYRSVLGRDADSGGLDSWASQLNSGMSIDQLRAGFFGSQEYFAKAGGTNDRFLAAAYQAELGRPLDTGGAAAWGSALAKGVARTGVALNIAASPEGAEREVTNHYREILGRKPDVGGLGGWASVSEQQQAPLGAGMSEETFLTSLVRNTSDNVGKSEDAIIAGLYASNEHSSSLTDAVNRVVDKVRDTANTAAGKVKKFVEDKYYEMVNVGKQVIEVSSTELTLSANENGQNPSAKLRIKNAGPRGSKLEYDVEYRTITPKDIDWLKVSCTKTVLTSESTPDVCEITADIKPDLLEGMYEGEIKVRDRLGNDVKSVIVKLVVSRSIEGTYTGQYDGVQNCRGELTSVRGTLTVMITDARNEPEGIRLSGTIQVSDLCGKPLSGTIQRGLFNPNSRLVEVSTREDGRDTGLGDPGIQFKGVVRSSDPFQTVIEGGVAGASERGEEFAALHVSIVRNRR